MLIGIDLFIQIWRSVLVAAHRVHIITFEQKHQIEGLMTKNPQINSIELEHFPKDYMKGISAILPNLDSLKVNSFDIGDDTLHFDRIKHFDLNDAIPGSIGRLSFAMLESLEIKYNSAFFSEWMNFLQRHRNISKFHLVDEMYSSLSVPLVELTANVQNMVEMSLECTTYVSTDAIGQFIRDHDKLQTFRFTIYNFGDEHISTLRQQFQTEWIINDVQMYYKGYSFERRM